MRFLTYNLWHGLSPSSPVAFAALEPEGRRVLRQEAQLELIHQLKPDICFFQEVNPVLSRVDEFTQRLGMEVNYQPDLVGLKLFGIGFPLNLNSGLTILAQKNLALKRIGGFSLSRPGINLVTGWGSWQLKEERFALFSEAKLPGWGKVLLINTHLHHGLEATPDFVIKLALLAEHLELSSKVVSEIQARMNRGSERRKQELLALLKVLKDYQRRYKVVVLGGDFNTSPESEVSEILRDHGFEDVWIKAHPAAAGFTFDALDNSANHRLQNEFPLTLVVEDLSFSAKVKEALLRLARDQENRRRRIDYLWVRTKSSKFSVEQATLVGKPDGEGFAPSDHFGICADLKLG